MIILTIRTDKPEAEVGIYDDYNELDYETWLAHRELSVTIHTKIEEILNKSSISSESVQGIAVYKGPGSFTGLRIGLTVANALAYGLNIPVVARGGDGWIKSGIRDLQAGKNEKIATPEYGALPHTTPPRK